MEFFDDDAMSESPAASQMEKGSTQSSGTEMSYLLTASYLFILVLNSFLNTEISPIVEIFPHGRQGLVCPAKSVSIIFANGMVTQGAKASADMILTSQSIPVSAPGR